MNSFKEENYVKINKRNAIANEQIGFCQTATYYTAICFILQHYFKLMMGIARKPAVLVGKFSALIMSTAKKATTLDAYYNNFKSHLQIYILFYRVF